MKQGSPTHYRDWMIMSTSDGRKGCAQKRPVQRRRTSGRLSIRHGTDCATAPKPMASIGISAGDALQRRPPVGRHGRQLDGVRTEGLIALAVARGKPPSAGTGDRAKRAGVLELTTIAPIVERGMLAYADPLEHALELTWLPPRVSGQRRRVARRVKTQLGPRGAVDRGKLPAQPVDLEPTSDDPTEPGPRHPDLHGNLRKDHRNLILAEPPRRLFDQAQIRGRSQLSMPPRNWIVPRSRHVDPLLHRLTGQVSW